jgi:hypothetical protein
MTVDGWNSNPFRFPVIPGKAQRRVHASGKKPRRLAALQSPRVTVPWRLPSIPPSTSWSCLLATSLSRPKLVRARIASSFIHCIIRHPSHIAVTALGTNIKSSFHQARRRQTKSVEPYYRYRRTAQSERDGWCRTLLALHLTAGSGYAAWNAAAPRWTTTRARALNPPSTQHAPVSWCAASLQPPNDHPTTDHDCPLRPNSTVLIDRLL